MTARPSKHPRARALAFAAAGLAAIAVACSMPAPDMVAPRGVNPTATPVTAPGTFYDFQVEKQASANPANMPPRYPAELRTAGIQGEVIAKFVVDTTGRADMRTFEIMKSDHEGFTTAVREALPDMRFYPAEVGGRKVKQLVRMPFAFSLVGKGETAPKAAVGQPLPTRSPKIRYETPADDSMPRLIDGAPPVYPNQLRAANIAGMVQASFVVRADGMVDMDTFMVVRSDHEQFTTAVRNAVAKFRFRPATKDGKPVSKLIMAMPFMFSLAK